MIKTVICTADAQRQDLCKECKDALKDGKITDYDVKASRLLMSYAKKFIVTDVQLKKTVDLGKLLLLVCTGNVRSLIGKDGKVVNQFAKELQKKVRIIEPSKNDKELFQSFLGKLEIVAINKVFKPEGQAYKVLLEKAGKTKLPMPKSKLENIFSQLSGNEVSIDFI